MKPIRNHLTTSVLGQPRGWDEQRDGPCDGLPIARDDRGWFYSFWRPSWKERLMLLAGVPVRLCIASTAHPPVSLTVENK